MDVNLPVNLQYFYLSIYKICSRKYNESAVYKLQINNRVSFTR
ncbi:hypothetical protein A1OE_293 [Candidatus Endolissoclinum faulkneri L2]|uniref:Uncharacterized protein n=1 Tax=Candidatus Endolissoclinum faulkneri L2 TaxID=1193729 RepID=K7Z3F2_9PROT|nr:hypothetical protein A1OE_293 [Candidatus Endolissoclinum faulkneri L2]